MATFASFRLIEKERPSISSSSSSRKSRSSRTGGGCRASHLFDHMLTFDMSKDSSLSSSKAERLDINIFKISHLLQLLVL